jgi:hypothetical protein
MRKHFVATALLFSLLFSINAFSQVGFATVAGSVSESTGALIPGGTVSATAVDFAIVTTTLLNNA